MFDSDSLDNMIFADDSKTAEGYNNIAVILLALFMPWDCLYSLFVDIGAINDNYLSFCWAIWCHCYPTLNNHVKYYATNILQIGKNKINTCELAARNDHTGSLEVDMIE